MKSTTAHGLSQLGDQKGCRRVIWFCICLAAYGTTAWAIISIVMHFMDPTNLRLTVDSKR